MAILLAAMLVISVAGCANVATSTTVGSSSATSEKATSQATGTAATTEAQNAGLLPYTGDEVTFDYFWFDTGADFTDETLPIVKALNEKLGNIRLNLEILSYADYQTKAPLLLAGGEIPDLMLLNNVYSYLSTYAPNGIFLDYAPLMNEYMPNINKYSQTITMYKTLQDTAGHQYALPLNVTTQDRVMQSWVANKTLLDELDIKIPETQAEFLDACRKVKAEKNITPIQRRDGLVALMSSMSLMFKNGGDLSLAYYPADGKWDFGPTRDNSELKGFLTFMNTLWTENLIDHEINTQTEDQVFDFLYGGKFAFTHDYQSRFSHTKTDFSAPFSAGSDFEIQLFPTPRGTDARITVDQSSDGVCNWACFTSANAKHPELLASCIDTLFSGDVATLAYFGIEGETYAVGDDGLNYYKDDVVSTAFGNFKGTKSMSDFGYWRSPWLRAFGICDVRAVRMIEESPEIYKAIDNQMALLDSGKLTPAYNYGYPTLTEEENTEISDITAPVNTYLNECIVKFIMGDMNLNTDWDTFMTKLAGYGDMDKVCEILNSKGMAKFSGNWR